MNARAEGRRTRVPKQKFALFWRMLADTELSASAKCIGSALLFKFHNNKTDQCNPSLLSVSKVVGRSRRAVIPAIAELRQRGWLSYESTQGGSPGSTNKFAFPFEPVSSASPDPVKPASPVKQNAQPVSYTSHEQERTTLSFGERVGDAPAARAPDGAAPEEEQVFTELCSIWSVRPHGLNPEKTAKAFRQVCDKHDISELLASAHRWVAATEPQYLKKLEDWLLDRAWQKEPPKQRGRSERAGRTNPVDDMLNAGGVTR